MLRFLDMVFQFLVIFLFLCLNRNPTFGFLVVVLLHLLSLLPIPWLPVGASSLLRLRIEVRDAMKKVGLDPEDRTKVEHYSLGMKQKLGLAQAIMEGQDILVLDEPFNALDYKTYNDVKEIIRTLHAEGKTILMTSHNYEDIETLCDEIYAIEDGQLGTPPADEMKRRFRG